MSLLITSGTLVGAYHLSPWYLAFACAFGLTIGIGARRQSLAIIFCLLPWISWAYVLWRTPQPASQDLSLWIKRRNVTFCGRICELLPAHQSTRKEDSQYPFNGHRSFAPFTPTQSPPPHPSGAQDDKSQVVGTIRNDHLSEGTGSSEGMPERELPMSERRRLAGIGTEGSSSGHARNSADSTLATTSPLHMIVAPQQLLFPVRQELQGLTMVTVCDANFPAKLGDTVTVRGTLSAPRGKSYPWQLDYAEYLQRKGIFSTCSSKSIEVTPERSSDSNYGADMLKTLLQTIGNGIDQLRERMIVLHRKALGEDQGDLLSSMVLGDRAVNLSELLRREFRNVGLSHVLAASGFNLSVVTGMTWWLGRFLIRNRWLLNLLCFCSMILFVLLAGLSPSVLRAAIMISFVLLARCLFRNVHTGAALAAALLVTLIVDPLSIADVGMQLSYVATAGIVCGSSRLSACLSSREKFRFPAWFAEALSIVTIAQLSVLPIQLFYFRQLGMFFLLANLLVDPLVPPITIMGFASSISTMLDFTGLWFQPAAIVLDKITFYPLKLMVLIVHYFANWEGSTLRLGPPAQWGLLWYYAAFTILILCLRLKVGRCLALAIFAASIGGLLWRAQLPVLTMAVFPRTVAVLNDHRESFCVGDEPTGDIEKFFAFYGAKVGGAANSYSATSYGGVTILHAERGNFKALIISDPLELVSLYQQKVPVCSAVIILDPEGNGLVKDKADLCVDNILEIVRQSHAKWVVLASRDGFRRSLPGLRSILGRLPYTRTILPHAGIAVLTLVANGNKLELEPGLKM